MADTVLQRIRSLLRWSKTSNVMNDSGDFPTQQVTYLGKVAEQTNWFPFGFHASPDLDSLSMMFSMSGNSEARVGLPGSPTRRPALAPGEVVLFHPGKGTTVLLKADGTVEITAASIALIGDTTITGTLDVSGDVTTGASILADGVEVGSTHGHDDTGSYTNSGGSVTGTSGVPL